MMLWDLSDIRVLSLWQPWASLCVHWFDTREKMAKENETRHWRPQIRTPFTVAIHATLKSDIGPIMKDDSWRYEAEGTPSLRELCLRTLPWRELPAGAIVGIANVWQVDAIRMEWARTVDPWELEAGNYDFGRFALRLGDVRRLVTPIPLKGKQQVLWPLFEARPQWDEFLDAQLIDPRPGAGRVGSLNQMRE